MPKNCWRIDVSNPSPYQRSDYVQVDLKTLGVDGPLDEQHLKLCRENKDGSLTEVPYQIDYPEGKEAFGGILSFRSEQTPAGPDDYSQIGATFVLEEGKPTLFHEPDNLSVSHYYEPAIAGEPADGFNKKWDKTRKAYGVKLHNDSFDFYISLVPHPKLPTEIDYTGSVTSVRHYGAPLPTDATDNMLSPFCTSPHKRWGQLTKLVFFPLAWELKGLNSVSLLGQEYELVWSYSGPVRAVVGLKSRPLTIRYDGASFFKPSHVDVRCNLYRVFSVYPKEACYVEELFVLTEDGISISFRPYYLSFVYFPEGVRISRARFEHISDYFAVWEYFASLYRGYGFAADSHVRELETKGHEIVWRLGLSHHSTCVHFFIFHGVLHGPLDPFHIIGHSGWYEKLYKPLRNVPLQERYPRIQ
jgi:hypothetical protein